MRKKINHVHFPLLPPPTHTPPTTPHTHTHTHTHSCLRLLTPPLPSVPPFALRVNHSGYETSGVQGAILFVQTHSPPNTHTHTRPLTITHLLTHSLTPTLTPALTLPLSHSPTHSLTHSFTHSPPQSSRLRDKRCPGRHTCRADSNESE